MYIRFGIREWAFENVLPLNIRDVTKIGHVGTDNFELTLKENSNIDDAKEYIKMSFNQVGG